MQRYICKEIIYVKGLNIIHPKNISYYWCDFNWDCFYGNVSSSSYFKTKAISGNKLRKHL